MDHCVFSSKWSKTAAFQHVWCWGVRVVWISNSALLSNYKKICEHYWIPQDKVVWVSPNSKTLGLYCGIWNPHYSGLITWQIPKCSAFSWFTRVY
jgi:hypothetical protein